METTSRQDQSHQVRSPVQRPPVSAEPLQQLEHQVEGILPGAYTPGRVGPQPDPAEDGLNGVAGPEMHPMFFGIVVEGDKVLPVPETVSAAPL